MKNLMIAVLALTGTAFAFPPQPEILQAQPNCHFIGSDNFGVCYKNNTGESLTGVRITLGNYMTQYAPIPNSQYAVLTHKAETKNPEIVQPIALIYSLSINGERVCPPLMLQESEMAQPVELNINKTEKGYECLLSN